MTSLTRLNSNWSPPTTLDQSRLECRDRLRSLRQRGAGPYEAIEIRRGAGQSGLREAEAGAPGADLCRKLGIREATFCVWKKKYGELTTNELRKMQLLEEENARCKRLVADLTLDPPRPTGTSRWKSSRYALHSPIATSGSVTMRLLLHAAHAFPARHTVGASAAAKPITGAVRYRSEQRLDLSTAAVP